MNDVSVSQEDLYDDLWDRMVDLRSDYQDELSDLLRRAEWKLELEDCVQAQGEGLWEGGETWR